MLFLSPASRVAWMIILLVLCSCGKKTPNGNNLEIASSERSADDYVPEQIFSDRLKKALYGPQLIVIPAGKFVLGAIKGDKQAGAQELPAHAIELKQPFAVSRTEITVAQFRDFIKYSNYRTEADKRGSSYVFDLVSGKLIPRDKINWQFNHIGELSAQDYPVVHVSFEDARAYSRWLSTQTGKTYRLASEAEWEYILRAGSQSIYPFGKKLKELNKGNLTGEGDAFPTKRTWGNAINNYADGYWGLAPVRQYASEGYGTFDMLGNVSEWVEDCWHENYRRAPANGKAWVNPGCTQRVVRGSAWLSASEQSRSSFRMPMDANTSNARVGFRVIREL
jgi:formylglycine-generating enzyme required for sulfatase activity